jgi:hypothetical protein
MYRIDASHLGSEGYVLGWQGRAVVPSYAPVERTDVATIVDRDGTHLHNIDVPGASIRSPVGPIASWPDEGLVLGVHADTFQVRWIDLAGESHVVDTDLQARALDNRRFFQLVATSDGGVIASAPTRLANLDGLGWSIDLRLDSMYGVARRAPFDDFEYVSVLVTPAGQGWSAPGRCACVADDVAIFEEGGGAARAIVARRVSDAGELWRQAAVDAFVLGSIPMPAWSDDRVYVLDRAARRAQAWAREHETAAIHRVSADQPMRTIVTMGAVSRARNEQPITAPSRLRCLSTRTGEELWHADVDGDVVSFHCHAKWVACVIASVRGQMIVWRHDGTVASESDTASHRANTPAQWPPDAARWPCIAWGDDEHLLVVQNRSKKQGDSRMYYAPIANPGEPLWETTLPAPAVSAPMFRWLRLVNRVPMAFVADAAFLRWGKQLHGFVG